MNLKETLDLSPESLAQYLSSKGFDVKPFKSGDIRYRLKSPWNPDERTPSAYIYASGILKCYSSGKSGSIKTLRRMFGGEFSLSSNWTPPPPTPKKPFNGRIPDHYLDITPDEHKLIRDYADSRCIFNGYLTGKTKFGEEFHLCVVFPHTQNGVIVGAKFRSIVAKKDKMRLRGAPGVYELVSGTPTMAIIIEGEANANSLWEYYKSIGVGAVVMSYGGASNIPPKSPYNLPTKVLIDYDGDDQKYSTMIQKWGHLGKPIKMRLPKGEDVNSMWCKGKIGIIEHLLV